MSQWQHPHSDGCVTLQESPETSPPAPPASRPAPMATAMLWRTRTPTSAPKTACVSHGWWGYWGTVPNLYVGGSLGPCAALGSAPGMATGLDVIVVRLFPPLTWTRVLSLIWWPWCLASLPALHSSAPRGPPYLCSVPGTPRDSAGALGHLGSSPIASRLAWGALRHSHLPRRALLTLLQTWS